jgi:hypothetical protein
LSTAHPIFLFIGVLAALIALLSFASRSDLVSIDRGKFSSLYDRWVAAHGTPKGVIVRQNSPKQSKEPEPDLGDYSFDRAVICDRARTVDLLLANQFHFENNCAVLSIDGYPTGPFDTVRAMLKRNPRLAVYALHDATIAGCQMAHKLATDPAWFAGQTKVIDVGLRPSHGKSFAGMLLPSPKRQVLANDGITEWEATWLAKFELEVAAIRPEQVLKRLFQSMNLKIDPEKYDDDVIYLAPRTDATTTTSSGNGSDGGSSYVVMSSDAGDSDGTTDSFG